MHINISNLLPKIDELHYIAKCSNTAVIGITKTKLDSTASDSKITVDSYKIIQNDRSRNDGGLACYIRNNICYNRNNCISENKAYIDRYYIQTPNPNTILRTNDYRI